MDRNDIKELAALMQDMGLTSLEYQNGDEIIKLKRSTRHEQARTAYGSGTASTGAAVTAPGTAATATGTAPGTTAGTAAGSSGATPAQAHEQLSDPREDAAPANAYTVKSPMVGLFYAAPSADDAAYVSLGDNVNVGDILCIIEAMKIMNEITAERDGVITEIFVENKQVVEYGQPLFRIGAQL
ncbi:MAG: acetyl-CoA carboxylase biotin carboxyl carrier protein [Oscillospiraceae bacterium]|nr:acetyl-CoA carboxylase biotin carboxyl carrier protein [Oscillospiraceae bacterium]